MENKSLLKFALYLGLLANSCAALALDSKLSVAEKQSWIRELDYCQNSVKGNCSQMAARQMLNYRERLSGSQVIINQEASFTLLYLHSYSMGPFEISRLSGQLTSSLTPNYFAPIFAAHENESTPVDYENVTAEEWQIDSELALKLAVGLGKPVVLQGFSMGALASIDLATRFPNLISKLVLLAPALKIRANVDGLACAGKWELTHYLVKKFEHMHSSEYLEKYLNGACTLEKFMSVNRNHFPMDTLFENDGGQNVQKLYQAQIEQFVRMGQSIKLPTFIVFATDDEAVDVNALKAFANNLPNAKVIVLNPEGRHLGHMGMIENQPVAGTKTSTFEAIEQFIKF